MLFGLALAGFWFWSFVIVTFIIMLVLIEEAESGSSASAVFIFTLAILQFVFDVPFWQWFLENPLSLLITALGYTFIGLMYTAIWKWRVKVNENVEKTEEDFKKFKGTREEFFTKPNKFRMHPNNHKGFLMMTTFYWPWSLFWELLSKPLIWCYDLVYALFGRIFMTIAKRSLK